MWRSIEPRKKGRVATLSPGENTKAYNKDRFFFQYQWFVLYKWKNTPCPKLNRRNKLLWVAFCHRQLFTYHAILISRFAASQSQRVAPRSSRKRTRGELFLSQRKTQLYIIKWLIAVFDWAVSVSASWYCASLPRHNDTGTQQSRRECQWQRLFLLWPAKTYAVKIYSKLHSVSHCQSISRCLCLFPPSP